jgi:hypothetical protein
MVEAGGIFAEIEAQPPLMRRKFIEQYLGVEVEWPAILSNASEDESEQARLICRSDAHATKMITGTVSLTDYPQLRHTHVGEPLRLHGRIRKIDTLSIDLEILDLVFSKAVGKVPPGDWRATAGSSPAETNSTHSGRVAQRQDLPAVRRHGET